MTEKKYNCGCIIDFDESGQGRIIKICESCKKSENHKRVEIKL